MRLMLYLALAWDPNLSSIRKTRITINAPSVCFRFQTITNGCAKLAVLGLEMQIYRTNGLIFLSHVHGSQLEYE